MQVTTLSPANPNQELPPLSVHGFHDLTGVSLFNSHTTSCPRAIQSILPASVERALSTLNDFLSTAPPAGCSSFAEPTAFFPEKDLHRSNEFLDQILMQLKSLYFADTEMAMSDEEHNLVRHILETVCAHFASVTEILSADGYKRFYINMTRNSFADQLHIHDYFSYILYCGREVGTEVVIGGLRENDLSLNKRKHDWMRHSHDVVRASPVWPPSAISNPRNGLFLPPHVAHKACHSRSQQGREQANLALVLLAFK